MHGLRDAIAESATQQQLRRAAAADSSGSSAATLQHDSRLDNARLAYMSLRQAAADLYPSEVLRLDHSFAAGTGILPVGVAGVSSTIMANSHSLRNSRRAASTKHSTHKDCLALLVFDRMLGGSDAVQADEQAASAREYAVHLRFLALDLR